MAVSNSTYIGFKLAWERNQYHKRENVETREIGTECPGYSHKNIVRNQDPILLINYFVLTYSFKFKGHSAIEYGEQIIN